MMKAESEECFEINRMLPPGPHRYFFSIDDEPIVAKDQEHTLEKIERNERRANIDFTKLDMAKLTAIVKNLPPKQPR